MKHTELPHYSTDIKAAWEVVERMRKQGFSVRISASSDPSSWRCDFISVEDFNRLGTGLSVESAAHAICLAALKAVE